MQHHISLIASVPAIVLAVAGALSAQTCAQDQATLAQLNQQLKQDQTQLNQWCANNLSTQCQQQGPGMRAAIATLNSEVAATMQQIAGACTSPPSPPPGPLVVTDVSPDMAYGAAQSNRSDSGGRIYTLVLDPNSNNQVLYGVSWGAGVWKSTDAAHSWQQASIGMRNGYAIFSTQELALDSNNSNRLIYATSHDDGRPGWPYGGLYVSTDAAAHWHHVNLPAATGGPCPGAGVDISSVVFSSGQPFVAAAPCGIFTNTDPQLADGSWTLLPNNLTPALALAGVRMAPNSSGNALFACSGNLIYRSTNLGQTWGAPVTLAANNVCWSLSVAPVRGIVTISGPPPTPVPDTVAVLHAFPQGQPATQEVNIVNFSSAVATPLGFNLTVGSDFAPLGGGSGISAVFTVQKPGAKSNLANPAYDLFAADNLHFFLYVPGATGAAAWKPLQGGGAALHSDTWSMAFPSTYNPAGNVCTAYVSNDGGIFQNNSSQAASGGGCDPSGGWVAAMHGLHTLETYTLAGISQSVSQTGCGASKPCPTLYLANGDNDVWAVTQGGASSGSLDQFLGDAGDVHVDPAYPKQVVLTRGLNAVVAVSATSNPPLPGVQTTSITPPNATAGFCTPSNCPLGPGNPTLTQVMALKTEQVSAPIYFAVETPPQSSTDLIVKSSTNPPSTPGWVSAGAAANFFAAGTIMQLRSSGGINLNNTVLWVLTSAGQVYRGTFVAGQLSNWVLASGSGTTGIGKAGDLFVNPYNSNYAWVTDLQASQIMGTTNGGGIWNPLPVLTNIATNDNEFRLGCHDTFFDNTCALSSMSFSRQNPNIAVAALYPAGVAYSKDFGQHWAGLAGVTSDLPQIPVAQQRLRGYPISVWYDDNALFNSPSIYVALHWNRTIRVDGNFSALPAQ
jgi:hypothetical protein